MQELLQLLVAAWISEFQVTADKKSLERSGDQRFKLLCCFTMTFTTYNLLSRKPWKDLDQIVVADVIYGNYNFYCGRDCSESISNARSFQMHMFVCAVGLHVGQAAATQGKAGMGWGWEGIVWPGLDGEGQLWLSCLRGFRATWALLWSCMKSLNFESCFEAGDWLGC